MKYYRLFVHVYEMCHIAKELRAFVILFVQDENLSVGRLQGLSVFAGVNIFIKKYEMYNNWF